MYHCKWEPVSRNNQSLPTTTTPNPSTPPRLSKQKSKIPSLLLQPGTPRQMVPLGSPRWSPRLTATTSSSSFPTTNNRNSVRQLLSAKLEASKFSGTQAVQVNGIGANSNRQRIYFIGGKSSTATEVNAPLDILALDMDEAYLGSETSTVAWRKMVIKGSGPGEKCVPRTGHVAISLNARLKETHLDRFENQLQRVQEGKSNGRKESKREDDDGEGRGRNQSLGKYIYIFGGEPSIKNNSSGFGNVSNLLNDMYRMLVWRVHDREPEAVGRWEQVIYNIEDKVSKKSK